MLTRDEFFHLLNKTVPRCEKGAEAPRFFLRMCQAQDSREQGEGGKGWKVWEEEGDRTMHRPFSG